MHIIFRDLFISELLFAFVKLKIIIETFSSYVESYSFLQSRDLDWKYRYILRGIYWNKLFCLQSLSIPYSFFLSRNMAFKICVFLQGPTKVNRSFLPFLFSSLLTFYDCDIVSRFSCNPAGYWKHCVVLVDWIFVFVFNKYKGRLVFLTRRCVENKLSVLFTVLFHCSIKGSSFFVLIYLQNNK